MDNTDDFDSAFDEAAADSAPAAAPAAVAEVDSGTPEGAQKPAESVQKDTAEPSTDVSTTAADPAPAADPAKPAVDPAKPAAAAKPAADPAKPAADPVVDPVDTPAKPLPKPVEHPQHQPLDPKYLAQAIAEAQRLNTEAQQPQKPAAPVKKTQADYLTAEQNAAIDRFKQDWPDEYSALMPLFNAQVQSELSNYRTDLTAELNQILAPLFRTVGTVEVNSHRNTLLAAHPDIDSLDTEKVREWIDTQPSMFRPTMLAAFEKGTTKDVVELLNMYKQSTGVTSAAPATPASLAQTKPTAVPAAPKQPVDPAAKAALAAVPAAQRQQPSARPGDDDFDAAFAEAVGQG